MTPAGLARAALVVGVILFVVLLATSTWPAGAPFAAGVLIAYAVLPVVNTLDRFLPRPLASAIGVLAVVGVIGGILFVVVPPLVGAVARLAQELPAPDDVDRAIDNLEASLGGLPEGVRAAVAPVLTQVAEDVKTGLAGSSRSLADLVLAAAQAAPQAIGALLGLIILPTWILSVLSDQQAGKVAVDRHLAPWLRGDFWAVVRIVDRAGSTYLRGFVMVGLLVGLFTYIGLQLGERFATPFQQPLPLAVLAGTVQLVPVLGILLGFLPALLIAVVAPDRAVAYVIVYIVAIILARTLVGRRYNATLGVHPAILIPGVAILSEVGLIWLLLSGPILAIATDAVRYFYGRFSDPPRPANLLPGETIAARARAPVRIPSAYGAAAGRAAPSPAPIAATTATIPTAR